MRFATLQAAIGSASLLFSAQAASVHHSHQKAHEQYGKRDAHNHRSGELLGAPKAARKVSCSLPDDPDLVHVPGADNNGFAMSPDEPCEDGKWCPIACVAGKVMAQWKPNTTYAYPESMVGGQSSLSSLSDDIDEYSSTVDCIATVERLRRRSRTSPTAWMVPGQLRL
jgi:hypothetical protein